MTIGRNPPGQLRTYAWNNDQLLRGCSIYRNCLKKKVRMVVGHLHQVLGAIRNREGLIPPTHEIGELKKKNEETHKEDKGKRILRPAFHRA